MDSILMITDLSSRCKRNSNKRRKNADMYPTHSSDVRYHYFPVGFSRVPEESAPPPTDANGYEDL